jgi:hypothetical protein
MTAVLPIFELEMYRAERLDYALRYLRDHESEIDPAMARARALALPIPVSTKEEFMRVVLGAVAVGSLALFWRGFHRYRTNLRPQPTQQDIEKACPDYKVRCHRGDPEDHVLRFLRDLRNAEIHPGAAYRYIACKRSPDEIIFQPMMIRELPGKRIVFLFHDLDVGQQLTWIEKGQDHWASVESTTFGEFLTEEAAACIRSFDAQRDGRPPLSRKPIEYAPDPATLDI